VIGSTKHLLRTTSQRPKRLVLPQAHFEGFSDFHHPRDGDSGGLYIIDSEGDAHPGIVNQVTPTQA
jgi:hypothetical protein